MDKYDVKDIIREGKSFAISSNKFDKYDLKELIDESKENNNCLIIIDDGNFDKYDLKELFELGGKIQLNSKWDKYDTKRINRISERRRRFSNYLNSQPAHNSTYPKVAVQWLNQALCFYQSLCLVDSKCFEIATFG